CLETRSVCGAAAACLPHFVKRRTNPAQVCLIFNLEVRRDRMPCPARSRGIDARGHARRALPWTDRGRWPAVAHGGNGARFALTAALRRAGSDRGLRSHAARSPAAAEGIRSP